MTPRLTELSLRHVDPSKLLLERDGQSVEPPTWFDGLSEGGVSAQGWIDGTVLVTLETKFHRPGIMYVAVAVTGMYANDEQMSRGRQGEPDSSTLDAASDEERVEFIQSALTDLYPSLRAELQILSSRFGGIAGITLQPDPSLNG
ncbi:hypothetical protein ERC79_17340 [Rhodococcus sp. ABRD24]|uniref:hypothetical protein n=1 Tax=Rhodococcus sp. ABRD24 TaxID=2507582 RepID=UPI0010387AB2|nr:hypothetical protein [Rhodococcus sp. ABRD24]QBJ97507.1 hypothetical protein ERC79_17340 [Rhodococcus sp. ABRD24]